jgi:hypothetical protein
MQLLNIKLVAFPDTKSIKYLCFECYLHESRFVKSSILLVHTLFLATAISDFQTQCIRLLSSVYSYSRGCVSYLYTKKLPWKKWMHTSKDQHMDQWITCLGLAIVIGSYNARLLMMHGLDIAGIFFPISYNACMKYHTTASPVYLHLLSRIHCVDNKKMLVKWCNSSELIKGTIIYTLCSAQEANLCWAQAKVLIARNLPWLPQYPLLCSAHQHKLSCAQQIHTKLAPDVFIKWHTQIPDGDIVDEHISIISTTYRTTNHAWTHSYLLHVLTAYTHLFLTQW